MTFEFNKDFLFRNIALYADPTDMPNTIEWVEQAPSPRFIKSHLPIDLLPKELFTKNPKVS